MPKVSICIPTYNQGQYLEGCVQSALNQTFEDIEVVVSVNHCTDNTEEVLKKFSDPRLRITKPDKFLSVGDNFKFCISQSRGEYFSFLCSDDVLLSSFVESQVKILDKYPNVAFVHSAAERIDKKGKTVRLEKSIRSSFVRKGSEELKRYIDGPKCVGDSALIRRFSYEAVGGLGENFFVIDWELWLRLLQYGDVAYNEKVLMKYRDWTDEYRSTIRKLELFKAKLSLYETYQPIILGKYPEWRKLFEKARQKHTLSAITDFMNSDIYIKNEAYKYIYQLSNSWLVRLKLILCNLGLGFIWKWKNRFRFLIRKKVKPLLYPKKPKKL